MADMPGLTYGRITGRFAATVADTGDALEYPDVTPLTGTISFQPLVGPVKVIGASPPILVAPTTITVELDAEGDLSLNGTKGVYLVATDGPVSPSGWVYRVTFRLYLGSQLVEVPQMEIAVAGGSVQDLAVLTPVSGGGDVTPQPFTIPNEVFIGGSQPTVNNNWVWFNQIQPGVYQLWIKE